MEKNKNRNEENNSTFRLVPGSSDFKSPKSHYQVTEYSVFSGEGENL